MKKHIKIPCFLCLASVPISSLVLIGCNNNNISSSPEIFGPEETTINLIHFSNIDNTLLKGFSYSGIDNPSNIVIENTFSQSLAVFTTRVTNINLINKTFDIEIVAYDAQPQELTGILSFYYENQLIEDAPTTQVSLNITPTPVIGDQFDRVQTIQLDDNGFGECTFEHFSIDFAPNLQELLDYNVQFVQAGTRIRTELIFIDDINFNLHVQVSSAIQGTIQSGISFKYNKHNLPITGSNNLTINIFSPKEIIAPTKTEYILETSQRTGHIIIPDFRFTSIEQNDLGVEINTKDNVVLSISILDWKADEGTFAVQIDATFQQFCNFTFTLSFFNKTTLEPFEYKGHDFQITTNSIVPREMLNIVVTQTSPTTITTLNGFNPESIDELQALSYNTLIIPNDITEIGDNAFNETPVTTLKNLIFSPDSTLLTIGNRAFYHTPFECDLIIPYSVNTIKNAAFGLCEKFKSLTFENTSHPISIADSSFRQCSGMRGDLRLPSYASVGSFEVFGFSGFDGTLYFPPHIVAPDAGFSYAFYRMSRLTNIDITAYTNIPSWMSDSAKLYFDDAGIFATEENHVFYNKNLSPGKLETLKQYFFEKYNLPSDFVFVPK